MKKILGLITALMVITSLAACANTFHGAGQDMENMGQWVQGKTQ